MVALDTSSMIAFLEGESGSDVAVVEWALEQSQAVFPPVVLSELLSDPTLKSEVRDLFLALPLLEVSGSYWERVGKLRALILGLGRRARLADILIAQSCLDHSVPLVTRDSDFRFLSAQTSLQLLH